MIWLPCSKQLYKMFFQGVTVSSRYNSNKNQKFEFESQTQIRKIKGFIIIFEMTD